MTVQGGAIKPVKVITTADLEGNGGVYVIRGNVAHNVHAFSSAERPIKGRTMPVYIVSDAEISAGTFRRGKNASMPVINSDNITAVFPVEGRVAIPVYDVEGTLSPNDEGSSLLTDLIHYWNLDEESGQRVATVGTVDFDDINTVGFGAGVVGNAASMNDAASEYLRSDANITMWSSATSWTISTWFKVDALTAGNKTIISNRNAPAPARMFFCRHDPVTKRVDVIYTLDPTADFTISTPSNSVQTTGIWYHVVFGYDLAENELFVYLNNTKYTGDPSPSVLNFDGTELLYIGSRAGNNPWDGDIDEVGIWSRVLTDDEVAALYNGGSGLGYPFT